MTWYYHDDYDCDDYRPPEPPAHPLDLPLEGWEFPAGRDKDLDGTITAFLRGAGEGNSWKEKALDCIAPLLEENPHYLYFRIPKLTVAPARDKPSRSVEFDLLRVDPIEPYDPVAKMQIQKLWLLGLTCWGGGKKRPTRFAYWSEGELWHNGGEMVDFHFRSRSLSAALNARDLLHDLRFNLEHTWVLSSRPPSPPWSRLPGGRPLPVPSTPFDAEETRRWLEKRKAIEERRRQRFARIGI